MRIYKMTATFGKLENQTLVLEPGLNFITAPNEWGKSTWCAFLLAMLYGIETKEKTKKSGLAAKERFAPWSGSPMEGRIDLNWNGRDITIQRQTKRRVPLGEFQAFETESGLPVPELTAANCGQQLLGVEQSVFRRAGFIRQTDLPVTEDEALRRRLNSLVTTGDESGSGDKLAESLKDLKNKCRYNRSGLLPQAEAQRAALEDKLAEQDSLENQCRKLKERLDDLKTWQAQLRNHQQALAYGATEENARRLAQARDAKEQAEQELRELEASCGTLPSREEAEGKLREVKSLREQWSAVQMERQLLPQMPEAPRMPEPFAGMELEEARQMLHKDSEEFKEAIEAKLTTFMIVFGFVGAIGAVVLAYLKVYVPAAIASVSALTMFLYGLFERSYNRKAARALAKKYASAHPEHWGAPLDEYEQQLAWHQERMKTHLDASGDLDVRYMMLQKKRESLCGAQDMEAVQEFWQQVLIQWDVLGDARREAVREQNHFDTLSDLVKPVTAPSLPDTLTCSEEETARLLSEALSEQQRLENRMGQYQGRMDSLGNRENLQKELNQCLLRIARLEDTYSALTIALETLADARAELQRRFAPRISKRAQELMSAMTDGRYHSLIMGSDFSLQASAGSESTLRDLQWRSDGTMDQLYLALRLAVAEELTGNAPLILDDALVRFDDKRMKAAVGILKELSKERQILLFTCQGREAEA